MWQKRILANGSFPVTTTSLETEQQECLPAMVGSVKKTKISINAQRTTIVRLMLSNLKTVCVGVREWTNTSLS